jgi:UDP-N-acetylmuramyl pentapeptide phosphotransferase/UDP-N-acetylglucosamine-1-phosphate transferase
VSGTLATYWINLKIVSTHIVFIDITLSIWFVPFFLAILSIALLSQSLNIIDGLNGLALGASIIILMSTIYLGLLYKDKEIVYLSILFVSCFIGIFIINFSTGKIFIGDGGAYFIGYVCASLILMLSMKNQAISPFAILLIVIFPIYETLRSFLRRVFSKKSKYFEPDDCHLHSKLYVFMSSYFSNKKKLCNSTSSFLILIGLVFFSFLAIKFHQNDSILILLLFLFIFLYETILKIIGLNFKKI